MISNIFCCNDDVDKIGEVYDWLSFNRIEFKTLSFWNSDIKDFEFVFDYENSVLICSQVIFFRLLSSNQFQHKLGHFSRYNNRLWVVGTDTSMGLLGDTVPKTIMMLDQEIDPSGVVIFIDATIRPDCYLTNLKKIKFVEMYQTFDFHSIPRIQSSCVKKTLPTYDYLLTTRKKPNREHRDILIDNINQRAPVKKRGLISFSETDESWIGSKPHQHDWCDGHASMDLYHDCYLEIVPETLYKNLHMITEKTYKPIMTHTPFLMVSTQGFLGHLHNQGFKTFDSLIDERYDQYHDVSDRIKHMLDTLEHIIDNGTSDFYRASQNILEHNFSRLCEISGRWQHEFDQMMWRALEDFENMKS